MDCFWCINNRGTNSKALEKLCSAEITEQLTFNMKKDLTDCYDCVLAYHNAKHLFLCDHENTWKELLAWEVERLSDHLTSVLYDPTPNHNELTENIDYLFQGDTMPAFFGFGDGVELKSKLSISLQEILNFPYLLWNKGLAALAVKGLLSLEEAGSPLIVDGKLPGIYLLLIHPNHQVRKWARKSVNFLGSVSCDDYDDLRDVVKWIMGVSEYGLFQCPQLGDDVSTQSSYTILPSHLFVQNPVKEFWLGVCMLLKSLEVNTVRLQLVSRDNHQAFVGVVVNALDHANSVNKKTAEGSDSEFWPVLHCFIILLERLGSRIWQYVSLTNAQTDVFRLITKHPAYLDELKRWPGFYNDDSQTSSTSCEEFDDGAVSSSQMVYSWDGRRRRSSDYPRTRMAAGQSFVGPSKRKMVVFAWFKPYIKSVVDFGRVGAGVVKSVLKYLHHLKGEFRVSSEGYDSTMAALIICLDHLLKGSVRSLLCIASDLWISDVIEVLKLEPSKQSRCRKLAHVFCKSVLERLVKTGVNVTTFLKSFDTKNIQTKPDPHMLRRLENLFLKCFKCDPTSPPTPRNFVREQRMIVEQKPVKRNSDTSAKDESSSKEGTSPRQTTQDYKFVMASSSLPFDVHQRVKKKRPSSSVSPKIKREPSEKNGKTLLDYFNKSPLLDARVNLQKLNVSKKVTRKGQAIDVLVVDDSDFESDGDQKEKTLVAKGKPPRSSSKTKKGTHTNVKKEDEGSVSSLDSSFGSPEIIPSKKFYGKGLAFKNNSKRTSLQNENNAEELLNDHTDDDYLESICSQFDTKLHARRSTTKVIGQRDTSKEYAHVAAKAKKGNQQLFYPKHEECIVVSDDSSSDMDRGDIPSVKEETAVKVEVKTKNEKSDDSWVIIDEEEEPMVKIKDEQDDDGGKYITQPIKTEKSDDLSASYSDIKPKIKIEVDYPEDIKPEIKDEEIDMLIKIEKNSPTWFPDEQNMTSVYEAQDFRFNGDDNWDLIISDGNDDDVLMDYLDVRDSLDTMTCVEADLSELPENDDVVVLLGPDFKNDTEDDDGVVSKNPSRSRVEDKRSEDLCSKQHESGADTEGHVAKRFETITVSTDTETEAKADVVISDDLSSASEDCNAKVERNRMDGNEMGTLLINAEETKKVAVIEPETTVSDLSSPELLKDSCLGAMVSKLRLAVQRTKSQGGFSLKSVKGDDGGVVGGPDKTLESAPKKAGQDKIEAEKKLKQKEAEGSENVNAENNEKLDVGVSRDIDISSPVDVGQTRHADAKKGKGSSKGNFADTSSNKDPAKIGIVRPLTVSENASRERSASLSDHPARGEAVRPLVRSNSVPARRLGPEGNNAVRESRAMISGNLAQRKTSMVQKVSHVVETKPKNVLTVEEFYGVVLKWDPKLLLQTPPKTPHIPTNGKVNRTFDSMDHYYEVFKPLIFLEVWAQAVRERKEDLSKSGRKEYSMVVDSVNHFVPRFQLIKCKTRISAEGNLNQVFVQESDLVLVEVKGDSNLTRSRAFALVEGVSRERGRWQPGDEGEGSRKAGEQYLEFTSTLRMLATARPPMVRETLHFTPVTSLITFIRQWKALMFLPRSLLARDILLPRVANCGINDLVDENDPTTNAAYNESQLAAIERTCESIRKPYPLPRMCFIQGPPGTGKSHTIIGLIKKHLKNRAAELQSERENLLPGSSVNNTLNQSSGRILLCAPSNAAIDVLVRRLIAEIRGSEGNLGPTKGKNCGNVNIVRIGRFSSIHPQVHPFTLDVLCKTQLEKLAAGDVKDEEAVRGRLEQIRGAIDKLEKQCYYLQCGGYNAETKEKVRSLNSEINELVKKKKHIERQYSEIRSRTKSRKRQEAKIKKDVLFSADIICSTLSGSGSMLLHNELLRSTKKHLPFGCVIVDEACQSCELDVLIPLQFGSSKLVMVGDPEQLRTTILSQKAQELLFGQSLYERHYRFFRERARKKEGRSLHATKDNPIQMLDVQYRMHPDIAAFPSSRVYQGRLKNAKIVTTRPSVCALKPYVVLNVRNGKEQLSPNGSICNPVEGDLVLEICSLLRKSLHEKHFGIVTPYRAQVNLLERRLRDRGMEKIEVNTVDGFQGREKEVIVMSCVRTSGQTKGIGFLADRQRMNVALTRARHSLLILLNAESLVTNKDWKACIDDANKRGFLHDVYSSRDLSRALQNETAANLEMVFKSPCQGDKKPTESTLGKDGVEDGFRKSGDKLPENARSEKDGQRTTVVDPRKIQGNNGQKSHSKIQKEPSAHGQDTNNCRGTLSGEGTGGKCIKGDHVTCASTVSGRPGDNDSQRFTYGDKDAKVGGSRERKRANGDNLDLSKRNLNTSKSRDVSSQGNGNTRESTGTDAGRDLKGTDLQGNRNRNNTHCEQNDAVQEASLGARKRKDGLDMVMELDRGSGSLTKCRGYEQRHGETQEDERVEKKRRIEKGVSRDSEQVPGNSERTSLKSDRKDPSRRQGDACDSERRDREESKGNSGPGRMSESDLGDLTFEGRYRGSDNSISSKRKMEDKHEERKRRKNGETGTRSSSLALQECVTKACKDEPNNYLTISNSRSLGTVNSNNESWLGGTQRSVSRSGLNETLMNADSLPGMAPVLSQTSDDFDFDEYVPTFDDHVSNQESSNGEPKQAAWKNSRPAVKPSQNIVCDQLVDRVVQSGGTLLARNDPYLNQLACHEQRERHARSVSVPSVSATSTPLDFLDVSASVKEIPRTVIHSLPDLVSAETKARTTSTHSKPTNAVRFSLPLQTHRAHPGESSTASALDNVIQRVKSKNPQRPPPPLLNQSDNLASFRRYHGGARERVAHGTRRNQQSNTENTRNIIQARISEFAGNSRERRVPNNMDKIRKSLKKK